MASSDPKLTSLWQFIHINQYSRPSRPIEETVRLGMKNFIKKIQLKRNEYEIINQGALSVIPQGKLDRVAPSINWELVASELDVYFNKNFNQSEPLTNVLILSPPSSGLAELLYQWGKQHKWSSISSPNYDEIINKSEIWFKSILKDLQTPFIIPNLEHWFLRHTKGLNLLRLLIDHLQTSSIPYIIGLDTWAWTYLKEIIQIESLTQFTIIMKAFSSDMFHSFLSEISHQNYKRQIFFRETTTGKLVIRSETVDNHTQKAFKFDNNFVKNLAGYTQGNPYLGWKIWRNSLRSDPDEEFLSKEEDSDISSSEKRRTLWILPWEKVEIPSIPESIKFIDLIILQTLLLHNGVFRDVLPNLLSFTDEDINRSIAYLIKLGFIEIKDNRLHVNYLVYPRIREKLDGEGFLTEHI